MSLFVRVIMLVGCCFLAWYIVRPNLARARGPCQMACLNNLRQLQGAKVTWALEHGKQTNDVVFLSDLIGPDLYIKSLPRCQQGGFYRLGRVGEPVSCSFPDHAAYANGR